MTLFAQLRSSYSLADMAIFFVILAVLVGIVLIVIRQSGLAIPQWVLTILGLVVLAVVAILAIRFVASL